jgi:hypothetical protein
MSSVAREGGIKFVVDVPEADLHRALEQFSAAGFRAEDYYLFDQGDPQRQHGPGRAESGWVRLGAERPLRHFTSAEAAECESAFESCLVEGDLAVRRVGTDSWTAGTDPPDGVREPRRPRPLTQVGAATRGLK